MAAMWARWWDVIAVCVLALPLVVAIAAGRARRLGRRAGPPCWRDAVAEVGAVAGTLPWLWMVLTPLPLYRQLHLVPFSELRWYLAGPVGDALVQLVGNLAIFAAFGAGAPVRWRLRLWTVALAACAGSVTIESLQYVLDMGRVASIDDVILNTSGAVLAALVTRPWWKARSAPLNDRSGAR